MDVVYAYGSPLIGDLDFEDFFASVGFHSQRFVQVDRNGTQDFVTTVSSLLGYANPVEPVIPIECKGSAAECNPFQLHQFDVYQETLDSLASGTCVRF